ncbi:MAG: MlrC family protein 3, partial [Magnetovibrio sp.]|nr:MlrC family protein 3 [Magnetovibrio sp.]
MANSPKIAILGLHLESNRFAPTAFKSEFIERCLLYGDELMLDSRSKHPKACGTLTGFVLAMDKIGSWQPAPLVYADGGAAGPIDHKFFIELKEDMASRLRAALPVDGIFFAQHGAALSTENLDPDGELYAMARDIVGPEIPIVSVLDLHAIISERMVAMTDV